MPNEHSFISDRPAAGYSLALHGGAGTLDTSALDEPTRTALHTALRYSLQAGKNILAADGTALDAVAATVTELENSPHFNAGFGACLTWAGNHELDAAIMDGRDLGCGAIAGVRQVRNPIHAARAVMNNSDHVMLGGAGADAFARDCGLDMVDNTYYSTPMRRGHWEALHGNAENEPADQDPFRFGTVGAVARDHHGNLAAATSTGGITNKRWGRIGDSPVIGAGTVADNRACAISCTGQGELFIRHGVAHEIASRMRLGDQSMDEAISELLAGPLAAPGGTGGIIGIDRKGRIALDFNTRGMYRAWRLENDRDHVAIEHDVASNA